jgi:excisionase family DNA binding protein
MAGRPRVSENGHGDTEPESIDYSLVRISLDDASLEKLARLVAREVAAMIPEPVEDRWINSREAAAYLGINYSTLKERAAAGELPAYQDTPGGTLWFKRSELDEQRKSGAVG